MPIYEYRCKACCDCFETLVWSSEVGRIVQCPRCASNDVERLLSAFSTACGSGDSSPSSGCGPRSGGFG